VAGYAGINSAVIEFFRFPGNCFMTIGTLSGEVVWVNAFTTFNLIISRLQKNSQHIFTNMAAGAVSRCIHIDPFSMTIFTFKAIMSIR
jgi:hypothetical protein